ncbi:DUF6586 family protein [Gynuella sunshinyii]|uniref:Uncharacterized protein n=1 Tax=Gynuella sunshinyii YC6258 TaxID=1445510 RepID=A0A0C5VM44_9GAMM|nr:DUF6586 family protein [Gynuella sunshinyii]AJQ95381.1 hypothetical Protein YC6258_03345 [Gynuella sunshinyii YC6258]
MISSSARTNHQFYRVQQLLDFMDAPAAADGPQEVLLDALAVEVMKAFWSLVAELADMYKVSGNHLENLRQYNPDMAELKEIEAQLADQHSWLSRLHKYYRAAIGQEADVSGEVNLLASDLPADTNFYSTCIKNLQVWVQQFRQQGQFW